ncbi:MAG: AraC family transcriptional regulator [Desulfobacteraceae bacterium]|jgi:AraC-like DNA-binding protein
MPYKEYQPHTKLSRCIDCFWSYTASDKSSGNPSIIIPDNMADILIDRSQSGKITSSFVGTMTRPIQSVKSDLLGIRFKPGYAFALFGIPMSEFKDIIVDLKDFWKNADWLEDKIGNLKNSGQQISFLQEMLIKYKNILFSVEGKFLTALKKINENIEYDSIENLSLELNISRQHLRRLFQKYTGINPVQYMRICRVRKVIGYIKKHSAPVNFCHLAQDFGYYDQSHMISDFKEFTLFPPSKYFQTNQ